LKTAFATDFYIVINQYTRPDVITQIETHSQNTSVHFYKHRIPYSGIPYSLKFLNREFS